MSVLEPVTEDAFGVTLDIVYATAANFTGKPIYARPACYLHRDAIPLLRRAVDLADRQGLRLCLFDAFRPAEAQWALWAHTPDPAFVSHPRKGSPHSMGVAIDLTLIDTASGQPLEMGSGFDDLRPISHHDAPGLSPAAERNRLLLLGLMTTAGWDFFRNEWWHYQMFDARARYPVLTDAQAGTRMMPEDRL